MRPCHAGGSLQFEELMLCSCCSFKHSSILMISSAISFKGSVASSNILLYTIFPFVPFILVQSCRICSWVSLYLPQNLQSRLLSYCFLYFLFTISIDDLALGIALNCFLFSLVLFLPWFPFFFLSSGRFSSLFLLHCLFLPKFLFLFLFGCSVLVPPCSG